MDTAIVGRDAVFGRGEEQRRMLAFLQGVSPAALIVEGEAGIGKSTLARWLAAEASSRGWEVLAAAPVEREASFGYAVLADLIGDRLDRLAPAIPAPQSAALAVAVLRETPRDVIDARVVGMALVSVLDRLAVTSPLLVVIDGDEWIDAASRTALAFAARRLPTRAHLVVTRREAAAPLPLDLASALPDASIEVLRLPGLSLASLHELFRMRDGWAPSRPELTRIGDASAGNPFYALELGRALRLRGDRRGGPSPLPVPPTLRQLSEERIGACSGDTRTLLLAVALAGAASRSTLVAALPRLDVDSALGEAEQAGLVDHRDRHTRIAHPLLALAVVGMATESARRSMHERLAAVAHDAEVRARHTALAAAEPDADTAAIVVAGADAARARGASREAAELYEAAIQLTPAGDEATVVSRQVSAADALLGAGDTAGARRLITEVLGRGRSGPASARTAAVLVLADLAWIDGTIAAARDETVRRLEEEPDPGSRLLLQSRLVAFDAALRPSVAAEAARAAIEAIDAEDARVADPRALGYLLINGAFAHALAGLGLPDGWLERGTALETGSHPATLTSAPLVLYQALDATAKAEARFELEDAWYRDRGEDAWRAERRTQLALVRLRTGDWAAARRLVDEACAVIDTLGGPDLFASAYAFRALVDAHGGEIDRARTALAPLVRAQAAAGRGWWTALLLSALVMTEFAAGRHTAAIEAAAEMRRHLAPSAIRDLLGDRSEPMLVECHLALGDPVAAADELARLASRGAALPRPWITVALARCRALLAAAAGDPATGLAMLDDTDPAARAAVPLEAAWSEVVRGRLLRRLGRKRDSAAVLDAALVTLRAHNARPWIAAAEDERRRIGLRARAADELTPSERAIADLAATGLTNREIATAVSLSPKTVEVNLSRAYAKLGIRTRAQLAARLAGLDAQT